MWCLAKAFPGLWPEASPEAEDGVGNQIEARDLSHFIADNDSGNGSLVLRWPVIIAEIRFRVILPPPIDGLKRVSQAAPVS
jgi:hypothetical protein